VAPPFSLAAADIRVVLCDIEGTTTPIAFVHDVLFPYARARIESFIDAHEDEAEVRKILDDLRAEQQATSRELGAASRELRTADLVRYIHSLMDCDRKSGPLKALQGLMWEAGYATGELKGEVYPDVQPAFERWTSGGVRVAIFSSGSILAQKLLFGHSTSGDLTRYLSGYFDTGVGPKHDAGSYAGIARALEVPAARVLFLSDVVAELDAARSAGMQALLSIRPPARLPESGVPFIETFDAIIS
jgi:enolase-phosphatase E1